jgi:hypothetical protein
MLMAILEEKCRTLIITGSLFKVLEGSNLGEMCPFKSGRMKT